MSVNKPVKQKYKRGTVVWVDIKRGRDYEYMEHFKTEFYGIVAHTYAQGYGGKDIDNYCIAVLSEDLKEVVDMISWYNEDQLEYITLSDSKLVDDFVYRKR